MFSIIHFHVTRQVPRKRYRHQLQNVRHLPEPVTRQKPELCKRHRGARHFRQGHANIRVYFGVCPFRSNRNCWPGRKRTGRARYVWNNFIFTFTVIDNKLFIQPVVAGNPLMRSTTNILIINLAVADLLFVVFCVPFTASDYILSNWPFGNFWCKFVSIFYSILSIFFHWRLKLEWWNFYFWAFYKPIYVKLRKL